MQAHTAAVALIAFTIGVGVERLRQTTPQVEIIDGQPSGGVVGDEWRRRR